MQDLDNEGLAPGVISLSDRRRNINSFLILLYTLSGYEYSNMGLD